MSDGLVFARTDSSSRGRAAMAGALAGPPAGTEGPAEERVRADRVAHPPLKHSYYVLVGRRYCYCTLPVDSANWDTGIVAADTVAAVARSPMLERVHFSKD